MTAIPTPLFVAIVDDAPVVCLGVAALLRPFRHRVRIEPYADELPQQGRADIVLYDPFMPPNTLGRLHEIGRQTGVPVVVFTSMMDDAQRNDAIRTSAGGVLSKRADGTSMVTALEAVAAGTTAPDEPTLDPDLPTSSSVLLGKRNELNAREAAIVALIAAGLTNREITSALHMSTNATKTHIRAAYRKMGVTSRTQAILWAVDHGFQLTAPAARLAGGHR